MVTAALVPVVNPKGLALGVTFAVTPPPPPPNAEEGVNEAEAGLPSKALVPGAEVAPLKVAAPDVEVPAILIPPNVGAVPVAVLGL